jgi:hypothetical protein
VVSQQSSLLAPLAVEAVLKVIDPAKDRNVDLKVCCFVLIRYGDKQLFLEHWIRVVFSVTLF